MAVASLTGAAAWAGALLADVEVEDVRNGDRVRGTLDPAAEVESFRFTVTAGTRIQARVKGVKRKGAPTPQVSVQLLGTGGATLDAGRKVKGVADATGEHDLVVTGDGTAGDYELSLRWKSPRKVSFGSLGIGAVPVETAFSAESGAVARVKVKAAKGSPARPRMLRVRSATGAFEQDLEPPDVGAKAHSVRDLALPDFGEYLLEVVDESGAGGTVNGTITLVSPKPGKRTIDVGGPPPQGIEAASGKVIGPVGGTAEAAEGSSVEGAAVNVPPGAVGAPTAFLIGAAAEIVTELELEGAGPSVFFGPEGATFATAVTVTIPYDTALFGADAAGLVVLTRDAEGNVSEIPPPYDVDSVAGTVTFPVSHFSAFAAFAQPRAPVADLNGDGVDDLVIPAPDEGTGGKVFVFFGSQGLGSTTVATADTEIGSEGLGSGFDGFGQAVAAGDVTGDGVAELVVGAPGVQKVYVFEGRAGFAPRFATDAAAVLTPRANDRSFGSTLLVADVDGDGVGDIVVGDPGSSSDLRDAGAVYVFPGTAGSLVSRSAGDAGVVALTGEVADGNERFGVSLAFGELTGDGAPDLVVGADQGDVGNGKVHVFRGPVKTSVRAGAATSLVFTGENRFDRFGKSVGVGDLDDDGQGDLVVGAPDAQQSASFESGMVYVFPGGANLAGAKAANGWGPATSDGANFGFSLVVGDADGDGKDEAVVGAPFEAAGQTGLAGAVFVGRPGGSGTLSGPPTPDANLGLRVLPLLDLDGDGVAEVAAAAPFDDAGGTFSGTIFIVPGPGLQGTPIEIVGRVSEQIGSAPLF